jgi:hypothetical protein
MSEESERLLTLKPSAGNASQTLNVLAAFEKAPAASCASNKSVEVSCQSFSKNSYFPHSLHGLIFDFSSQRAGGLRMGPPG